MSDTQAGTPHDGVPAETEIDTNTDSVQSAEGGDAGPTRAAATGEAGGPVPGAPVEEVTASESDVLAAVDRASSADAVVLSAAGGTPAPVIGAPISTAPANGFANATTELQPEARPTIAVAEELPSAGPSERPLAPDTPGIGVNPPADGQIVVSADHPMAALYMQSPMPPETRGNRGAGILIGLLATLSFGVLYAGALAAWLAPHYPPSTFLEQGVLTWVTSWAFLAACVGFFVGFSVLVLVAGRAGWWVYALFGFLVAGLTWAATLLGYAFLTREWGGQVSFIDIPGLTDTFGLTFPVIAAALVAREVTTWFGAWVGARGRRIGRQNAAAIAEYEAALEEVQAKRS